MVVGIVLDPGYEIDQPDYFFSQTYGDKVESKIERVNFFLLKMIIENALKNKENQNVSSTSNQNQNVLDVIVIGKKFGGLIL